MEVVVLVEITSTAGIVELVADELDMVVSLVEDTGSTTLMPEDDEVTMPVLDVIGAVRVRVVNVDTVLDDDTTTEDALVVCTTNADEEVVGLGGVTLEGAAVETTTRDV